MAATIALAEIPLSLVPHRRNCSTVVVSPGFLPSTAPSTRRDANSRHGTTHQELQKYEDAVMAMIEAEFPDPFALDGEIVDG